MEPAHLNFGGGPSSSVLHPLVAVAMVVAIAIILFRARAGVIVPALLAIFLIPKGQQLVIAGIHFNVYRILIIAGLARCLASPRWSRFRGGFGSLDGLVAAMFISLCIVNSTLHGLQGQAIIKNIGDLLDYLGGYVFLRFLVRDRDDVQRAIQAFVVIAVVNAGLMMYEQVTGDNFLRFLGGVPIESTRDGKVRSQGSFAIFLTAGTFGGALIPFLVWMWSQAKRKLSSAVGIASATIMAITCHSTTSLMSYGAGVVALCLWPIRKSMRLMRWGIVLALILLHMVMNGPVWSLLEKIDLTGSSSSYHRYALVDNLVRHFPDWWLMGTTENGSWGYFTWDLSNQYVAYAFYGGLWTLVLFIAVISKAFSQIGKARRLAEASRPDEWFIWCLGAAVFSHVISFLGVNYMDQLEYMWFMLLASISAIAAEVAALAAAQTEPAPDSCAVGLRDRPAEIG